MKERILKWLGNVVGGLLSSKKTLATVAVCFALITGILKQDLALTAFIVWMFCQTGVDIARIIKGKKD